MRSVLPKEAHKGVRRRSGEPYIIHPIAVAKIASQEIGLGSTSICAALLHDVVEDTEYTVEDIEQHFGRKIARIVEGLTKISGGIFRRQGFGAGRKFPKAPADHERGYTCRAHKDGRPSAQHAYTSARWLPTSSIKIAGETLYIYAPLAHRLGLFEIKTELEDLSFKYEHPGNISA